MKRAEINHLSALYFLLDFFNDIFHVFVLCNLEKIFAMRALFSAILFMFFSFAVHAQEMMPMGGGDIGPKGVTECVAVAQRKAIEKMLDSNRKMLIRDGKLQDHSKADT
ncbi:MAG: hypothetical protein JWQ38_2509 [Flavipsychrobacter sp.]|nr:hypothetical protein [Flavipsychrobacter sp.]